MGVCAKHWPSHASMIKVRRFERPKDPPSIFPNCPQSLVPKSCPTSRNVESRGLSLTQRASLPDELEEFQARDQIPGVWSEFLNHHSLVELMKTHKMFSKVLDSSIMLFSVDDFDEISVRVKIASNMTVKSFKCHTKIKIRDLLGFQPTLKSWSQLDAIISRTKNEELSISREIFAMTSSLRKKMEEIGCQISDQIYFLLDQLDLIHVRILIVLQYKRYFDYYV